MKVIVEKREIIGTLKSLVGTYGLLGNSANRKYNELFQFHVVDDEGFDNWIALSGDFIVIPSAIPTRVDVKRILVGEEDSQKTYSEIYKKLSESENVE